MIELESGVVTITLQGHVADVRLNRPEKLNAVDPAMWRALSEAGGLLAETKGLRAVVLSGNGRAFCSGLDLASFQAMGRSDASGAERIELTARPADAADDLPGNVFQRAALVWKRLPVPVIAALHGVAFGAGAQIALGADLRIAAPDLRFGVLEIQWGLVPDVGLTQTLRDLVRLDVAKELVFTGRIVQAEEALALGLVTRLSNDPLAHATTLAHEIAARSPDAIRLGKQLLESSWQADEATGLALEAKLQARLIGSPNQLEAIRAHFEKRAPKFEDPD